MNPSTTTANSARAIAAESLARAAKCFPHLGPCPLDSAGLDDRDAHLALAIHRTALQRWLTLEYVLDGMLRQPMHALEASLRGVLLSGAAQLLFLPRLPAHAVVDESVQLARQQVRPGAAGLVNAVLRRLAPLVGDVVADQPWTPGPDRLPLGFGFLSLREPLLPPIEPLDAHLAAATSHPLALVRHWLTTLGPERTTALCVHNLQTPPTIVAVESGFDPASVANSPAAAIDAPGFVVWNASHQELLAFLGANRRRRVQDPAAALAVQATADLAPKRIVDYCAGRGTKTRQLAMLHPQAQVFAADPDARRLGDLRTATADLSNVHVLTPSQMYDLPPGTADLLVLDVPCSNTAVLARRPEARYRFNPTTLRSLIGLQRHIFQSARALVGNGGHILYSTCSLEEQENGTQARWLCANLHGSMVREQLLMPASAPAQGDGTYPLYHDGSYHALLLMHEAPGARPGADRAPLPSAQTLSLR
jgi:16S rRNA (cytosine967-C5)-methyltransferase